jgi:hypothetical protein
MINSSLKPSKHFVLGHCTFIWFEKKPKTVVEMYNNFAKFSKSDVLHFWKLEK